MWTRKKNFHPLLRKFYRFILRLDYLKNKGGWSLGTAPVFVFWATDIFSYNSEDKSDTCLYSTTTKSIPCHLWVLTQPALISTLFMTRRLELLRPAEKSLPIMKNPTARKTDQNLLASLFLFSQKLQITPVMKSLHAKEHISRLHSTEAAETFYF